MFQRAFAIGRYSFPRQIDFLRKSSCSKRLVLPPSHPRHHGGRWLSGHVTNPLKGCVNRPSPNFYTVLQIKGDRAELKIPVGTTLGDGVQRQDVSVNVPVDADTNYLRREIQNILGVEVTVRARNNGVRFAGSTPLSLIFEKAFNIQIGDTLLVGITRPSVSEDERLGASIAVVNDYGKSLGKEFIHVFKYLVNLPQGSILVPELHDLLMQRHNVQEEDIEAWVEGLRRCGAVMTFEHSPDPRVSQTVLLHTDRHRVRQQSISEPISESMITCVLCSLLPVFCSVAIKSAFSICR